MGSLSLKKICLRRAGDDSPHPRLRVLPPLVPRLVHILLALSISVLLAETTILEVHGSPPRGSHRGTILSNSDKKYLPMIPPDKAGPGSLVSHTFRNFATPRCLRNLYHPSPADLTKKRTYSNRKAGSDLRTCLLNVCPRQGRRRHNLNSYKKRNIKITIFTPEHI